MKFDNFSDWIDSVCDNFNATLADIVYGTHEYSFKLGEDLVAYWDRDYKFGFISMEY